MALTILHITDLHFGWDGDDANKRAERSVCLNGLLHVIAGLDPSWKPSVICLSGDVAWRGAANDYADARQWLNRLLANCGIGYERLVLCPGNHDAGRGAAKKNARPDDAAEADEVLGVPIASQFIAPFVQFVEFCKATQIVPMKIGDEESYLVGERELDGYRFVSLNSAWFAKDDRDEKKLWLGLPHMRVLEAAGRLPLVRGESDSLCTIALVHHPKEWLHPHESNAWASRPNTWDYLAGRCHILLTGHTHGEVRRADRIAEGVFHFTGGSTYAGASHFNSFRLLRVDWKQKQIDYISYEFDPRSAENEWKPSKEISLAFAAEGRAQGHVHAKWLKEYARNLEASLFAHLYRQEQSDSTNAQSRYIEVLVREHPNDRGVEGKVDADPRPLSDFVVQSGVRALVLGGGGSGKTSVLRKMASDYCRRALSDAYAPLAFFARLNLFDTHTDVLNGLLNIVAREADLSMEELRRLWSDGSRRCLFLFDGLNEVRPEFIGDCQLALQQFTERAQHNYVISSRPGDQAIELQRQIGSLKAMDILSLDPIQIRTYLQGAGVGNLYDHMEDRLRSLARNPFLLWAIAESCDGLPSHELPKNVGQLYKNLIDRYIFGIREESKPRESRPTQYNYTLVKKPVMARFAVEMCRQGATRWPENSATLKPIRDHLHELSREADEGIRSLRPHEFMPKPFAKALLDELVENGILQRLGTTLEFMHESVRDYFAAVELSDWPVEKVLESVSPLVWRHVEPEYHELEVEGTLVQAVIMSAGLRRDAGNLLERLIDHHPLLAAHCYAAAAHVAPDVAQNLLNRWLALLDKRLKRYRWIGCQCLRAARVHSTNVARRLLEVIRSDPEWEVGKSAARAFAAINDPLLTKNLVAQAVSDIPEHDHGADNLGKQFRHLQTDTLVAELLTLWGDPNQVDARKRRVEKLFAQMRTSSTRQALQRLAEKPTSGRVREDQLSHLARSALDVLDSWTQGSFHMDDVREAIAWHRSQFEANTSKVQVEMSTWSRADLLRAIKDPDAARRAAAARILGTRKTIAIAELLEAVAREQHGRVADAFRDTLRMFEQPTLLFEEWQTRIRDQRWPLLFSVGPEFADDLANLELSERWINEFKKRQIELPDHSQVRREELGWMIRPSSWGGRLHHNPVYRLRLAGRDVEVFDAAMRPRLVAAGEMIGPRAIPVLKELLAEKDELLQIAVAEILGTIATPEAVALLSECLSMAEQGAIETTIKGLEESRSKQAVHYLIEAMHTSDRARGFSRRVGKAIGVLNGVDSLIQFAHKTGMHGDEACRLATVSALSSCGHKDLNLEEALLLAANDPGASVRREAVRGLARMRSPKAQEKLLSLSLEDFDREVREEAGQALRYFPGDAGVPKLISVLESAEDELRVRAAEALARIEDDAAIPALVRRLSESNNNHLIRIAAANSLDALGFDQVETLIKALCPLAHDPSDVMIRREAAEALRRIPGGEDKLYETIRQALTGARYEEVIELIGSDTPFLLDDVNLYWWRGLARYYLERHQDALADLDHAIDLAECPAMVHRVRANVLSHLNRLPEALAAAERAAEIDPNEADNHFLVGWWAYRLNALEKSVAASRRALELNPNLPMAELNLGLALLASGQSPEDMDAYNRGSVLCAQLDQENAQVIFDTALRDLDALVLQRPQLAAGVEEAKARLLQAREASVSGKLL